MRIDVDEVYRKPSNFFQLKIVSQGKIFRLPDGFSGAYNKHLTVYDKATGGTLACSNFGFTWKEIQPDTLALQSFITKQFLISLAAKGYLISKKGDKFERTYIVYSTSKEIQSSDGDIYKLFDGFEHRIVLLDGNFFLCLNPHLKIKTVSSVKELIAKGLSSEKIVSLGAIYCDREGKRVRCNIVSATADKCRLRNLETGLDEDVNSGIVYIVPKPDILQGILLALGRKSSIIEIQRQYSFLSQREAAKGRFTKTLEIASNLADQVFPLRFAEF